MRKVLKYLVVFASLALVTSFSEDSLARCDADYCIEGIVATVDRESDNWNDDFMNRGSYDANRHREDEVDEEEIYGGGGRAYTPSNEVLCSSQYPDEDEAIRFLRWLGMDINGLDDLPQLRRMAGEILDSFDGISGWISRNRFVRKIGNEIIEVSTERGTRRISVKLLTRMAGRTLPGVAPLFWAWDAYDAYRFFNQLGC